MGFNFDGLNMPDWRTGEKAPAAEPTPAPAPEAAADSTAHVAWEWKPAAPAAAAKPEPAADQGRLPTVGAEGRWSTNRGVVDGRVVEAKLGGPFVIETARGRVQVEKFL